MSAIKSYRDLEIWKLGIELAKSVYALTSEFPKSEIYGITSQIRRAAASVPANIAEGWGRNSNPAFAQFIRVARGSLTEVETFATLARELGYFSLEEEDSVLKLCDQIGRKTYNFLEKIVPKEVREEIAAYLPSDASPFTLHPSQP